MLNIKYTSINIPAIAHCHGDTRSDDVEEPEMRNLASYG
jgi:hypothetical protein